MNIPDCIASVFMPETFFISFFYRTLSPETNITGNKNFHFPLAPEDFGSYIISGTIVEKKAKSVAGAVKAINQKKSFVRSTRTETGNPFTLEKHNGEIHKNACTPGNRAGFISTKMYHGNHNNFQTSRKGFLVNALQYSRQSSPLTNHSMQLSPFENKTDLLAGKHAAV
ncbi:hypothetical protein GF407_19005 [candidate division KSB1 bacterium]|nr:hypothetical protein [candidate division KSB1 bacterium]